MTMEEENFDLESLNKALPRVEEEEDGAKAVQMPEGEQIVTNVESLLSLSMKARGSTKQREGRSIDDIKDMLSQSATETSQASTSCSVTNGLKSNLMSTSKILASRKICPNVFSWSLQVRHPSTLLECHCSKITTLFMTWIAAELDLLRIRHRGRVNLRAAIFQLNYSSLTADQAKQLRLGLM